MTKYPYEYHERVAICMEAGIPLPRAEEIAGQQPITTAQLQRLQISKNEAKLNDTEFRQILGRFGHESSKNITMQEFDAVLEAVKG